MQLDPDRPVLIDKYLDRADELDVDALCDKDGNVVITGIMQHIEQAPSPLPPGSVLLTWQHGCHCQTALSHTQHRALSSRPAMPAFSRG